jgi:diacylglycerol kinase
MENNISAQENLDYIKNVILDSKNIIKDNGAAAILWGIIIVIAQLSTFILS